MPFIKNLIVTQKEADQSIWLDFDLLPSTSIHGRRFLVRLTPPFLCILLIDDINLPERAPTNTVT